MAREYKPDIVVLDINMPELNGLAAYKRISQTNPNIGCIIISAEKDLGTMRAAMSIGIKQYLTKPFTADELETAVIQVSEQLEKTQESSAQTDQLQVKNTAYLRQLADEFAKAKRTDDQAIQVFEEVIKLPNCEPRWVQTLAMIYILRNRWDKLKVLADWVVQRKK
jgi:YesN/AraC family two-component response regulator